MWVTQVLADTRVNHYFRDTDMAKQRAHQAAFMTFAFGGADNYQGKNMVEAHRHLDPHLTDIHFNAIVEHFTATLKVCLRFESSHPAAEGSKRAPLIERLGGPEAVRAAVDIFYQKVLADDRVSDYFKNTDMNKQRAHQAAFMAYAFGGANAYTGKDLAEAHRHLQPHLNDAHFAAIAENFVATLKELGVAQEDIDDAVAVVASTKPQVLAD
eukprot:gene11808-11952_t